MSLQMSFTADMRKDLKRSIIVLVSLIAFERIINAEDDDDAALAKINNLFLRYPRMASSDNELPTLKDSNTKRELESKLSDLLEFGTGATKWPVLREDVDEAETTRVSTSEISPFKRFDPVDKDEEEGEEEYLEYASEEIERQDTTKHSMEHKNKHTELVNKIRKKLTDKETKFTVSLPVAIVIVGSIILVTCCCSLYLRNRLAACVNTVTGRKKKKSKMLAVDAERGRTPRSRKKSISSNKKRARSLSQDFVNIATQKSSTMAAAKDIEEESTTGCYRCCKKKKKRGKKVKR